MTLTPDFEEVMGLTARRSKPAAAWRRLQPGNGDVPAPLTHAVERVVAAARRGAADDAGRLTTMPGCRDCGGCSTGV